VYLVYEIYVLPYRRNKDARAGKEEIEAKPVLVNIRGAIQTSEVTFTNRLAPNGFRHIREIGVIELHSALK
jgi:hypothetical protein